MTDSLLAGYKKPEDLIGGHGLFKKLVRKLVERALGRFGLCFLFLRNVKGFQWNHKQGLPDLPRAGAKLADQA